MKELFDKYKISVDEEILDKFNTYYELLCFYNEKFNLTAITEKKDVYIKHFIDSLLFKEFSTDKTLIDIGSGGGFPALPIAIMNKTLSVTLLEATEKKCGFLNEVINKLNLLNAKVICGRAEDFAKNPDFREKFDYATARAVAKMNILTEYCLPFVKKGGSFIAFKGSDENEIKEAENSITTLGGKLEKVISFDLEDAKRNIAVVKKVFNTPINYPRINGQIRKKPL